MRKLLLGAAAGCAFALHAADAFSDPVFDARIAGLARTWDHVNYQTAGAAKVDGAAALAAQAQAVERQYPHRAEPVVWEAIALSTEAGAKGGLGGLALAKDARAKLEAAERIDPAALGDGSVYTSLGSLYAQVPGFPIGFGDKERAGSYLKKALAMNPAGADPNYFYGDLLYREGKYAEAETALLLAEHAPPRPGREVGDQGRRAETLALLGKVRAKRDR
jgi:tetratricopeptide (TPR) repeat protein